eukprot:6214775-Pleurochrysis_carterae.AAC.2
MCMQYARACAWVRVHGSMRACVCTHVPSRVHACVHSVISRGPQPAEDDDKIRVAAMSPENLRPKAEHRHPCVVHAVSICSEDLLREVPPYSQLHPRRYRTSQDASRSRRFVAGEYDVAY